MSEYPRLSVERALDKDAECLYRYVYGKEDVYYPHCHDFYEIFLTVRGVVTHQINGKIQKLPEGSLVFIRPDDIHGYVYNTDESLETAYINLTFSKRTAEELFRYLSDSFPINELLLCDMPFVTVLNNVEKKRLLSQIEELNIVNWQDKDALKLRMRSILADVFVRHFYLSDSSPDEKMPLWLSYLLSEMERPENFIAGIDRMTQISKKSREHVARTIQKYCGITVSGYINELRVNYASNLLLHTNTNILDICYACGFQSVSYFYKVFKQKYKLSPKEFRKM